MEQKLANCLKAFKIFILAAIILATIIVVSGGHKKLWLVKNENTISWKTINDSAGIRNPNIYVFSNDSLQKNLEPVSIKNLHPEYEQSIFEELANFILAIFEIWILIITVKLLRFIYKLSVSDLFELKTPIQFRKLILQLCITNLIAELIEYYYYYTSAIHTQIANYQIGLFNFQQLDVHIIPSTIILLFLSYIWQYAISIKSENDLTV